MQARRAPAYRRPALFSLLAPSRLASCTATFWPPPMPRGSRARRGANPTLLSRRFPSPTHESPLPRACHAQPPSLGRWAWSAPILFLCGSRRAVAGQLRERRPSLRLPHPSPLLPRSSAEATAPPVASSCHSEQVGTRTWPRTHASLWLWCSAHLVAARACADATTWRELLEMPSLHGAPDPFAPTPPPPIPPSPRNPPNLRPHRGATPSLAATRHRVRDGIDPRGFVHCVRVRSPIRVSVLYKIGMIRAIRERFCPAGNIPSDQGTF